MKTGNLASRGSLSMAKAGESQHDLDSNAGNYSYRKLSKQRRDHTLDSENDDSSHTNPLESAPRKKTDKMKQLRTSNSKILIGSQRSQEGTARVGPVKAGKITIKLSDTKMKELKDKK